MDDFRDRLCARISERIKARGYCIVYDSDLCHLARPLSDFRKQQISAIQAFAAENGLAVTISGHGIERDLHKNGIDAARPRPRLKAT